MLYKRLSTYYGTLELQVKHQQNAADEPARVPRYGYPIYVFSHAEPGGFATNAAAASCGSGGGDGGEVSIR